MEKVTIILSVLMGVITTILVLTILSFTGVVTIEFGNNNTTTGGKTTDKEPVVDKDRDREESEEEILEKLNIIIEDELYVFNGKQNLRDFTNQDKLAFAYGIYVDENGIDHTSFKGEELMKKFKASSLGELGLTHENMYLYDELRCSYDEDSDTYELDPDFGGHGIIGSLAIYKRVDDYKFEDDTYTVSKKYLWVYDYDGEETAYIQGSYEGDRITDNEVVLAEMSDEDYEELIENNKIETYHYVFEKIDGEYKIIDFYTTMS